MSRPSPPLIATGTHARGCLHINNVGTSVGIDRHAGQPWWKIAEVQQHVVGGITACDSITGIDNELGFVAELYRLKGVDVDQQTGCAAVGNADVVGCIGRNYCQRGCEHGVMIGARPVKRMSTGVAPVKRIKPSVLLPGPAPDRRSRCPTKYDWAPPNSNPATATYRQLGRRRYSRCRHSGAKQTAGWIVDRKRIATSASDKTKTIKVGEWNGWPTVERSAAIGPCRIDD